MSIFKRLFRVAKGQANSAVDSIEDATFEKTLKQNIRDMEKQLADIVRSSAEAMSNHNRLENEYSKWQEDSNSWKDRATKALQAGKEDLAKKALAKKQEADEQAANLEQSVEGARAVREKLKSQVEDLRQRIEAAKRNSSTLIARRNAAKAQKQIGQVMAGVNVNDDAFSTLKRFEENVEKEEATAKAYEDMSFSADKDLEDEFAALDTTSTDDELAALKAELGM